MKYDAILLDLDDTIFDFKKAEIISFEKLFTQLNMKYDRSYLELYQEINHGLWHQFELGNLSISEVVNSRFTIFFKELNIVVDGKELEKKYQYNLSLEAHFIDDAYDVLLELKKRCKLYIVSNGVASTQYNRLKLKEITHFFEEIFISEEVGFQKPNIKFFEHVFHKSNIKDKKRVLMVGDSLSSDILGGIQSGIDTCLINSGDLQLNKIIPTYQIKKLSGVLKILESDILANYHMHTYMCKHSNAFIDDYVKLANELNFQILGFSEHGYLENKIINNMERHEFEIYLKKLNQWKSDKNNKVKILIGLEMDFYKEDIMQYRNYLNIVDYLICSVHFYQYERIHLYDYSSSKIKTQKAIDIYTDLLCSAMETKLFSFVGHPDMFMSIMKYEDRKMYIEAAKKIVACAKKNNIILEFNANGMRKPKVMYHNQLVYQYPRKEFFDIVKSYDCEVIVNSDCHENDQLYDYAFIEAIKLAKSMGLNVVHEIPLHKKNI